VTGAPTPAERDQDGAGITPADLERQLRALFGPNAGGEVKIAGVAAGAAALAVSVAAVYLLGRRKGRRRASVLEIRRV
jgi:hypothetical protein